MDFFLSDKNATTETTALYKRLNDVVKEKKVLFGHQNSTWISVGGNSLGDVYDVLNALPAIVGIDTLALSGNESTCESYEAALDMSVELCKKAYKMGCIITLSGHMPNFSSPNIVRTSEGKYDFTGCDFMDTKDKSNDCAYRILEGGEYNEVFNAYLDMIVSFLLELDKSGIPVIFRPWHENNGEWFWWGVDIDGEQYKKIYQYTACYLKSKGVHNLLYVYSPNGPFKSEEEYMDRYPGDEFIDIMAFDYYDDYLYGEAYRETFFNEMKESSAIISKLAKEHKKIAAISEAGVRVAKDPANEDMNGFLKEGNPVLNHNWFIKIGEIAIDNDMPYFLVWGNFCNNNHYLPYLKADGTKHEMAKEFEDFYNWNKSIFV